MDLIIHRLWNSMVAGKCLAMGCLMKCLLRGRDRYPVLIDAVVQSTGLGFVGTDRSTMSILARRRVQTWQDGAVRTIKWGRLGSDDH